MTYVIDIDGTICKTPEADYQGAIPYPDRIKRINSLFDQGHIIKYFTARGSTTGINWRSLTKEQLEKWGAKYHELILGKPYGDIYIDDRAIPDNLFFKIYEIKDEYKQ